VKSEAFTNTLLEGTHTTLDVLENVPYVNYPAASMNLIMYLDEEEYDKAIASGFSLVPFPGSGKVGKVIYGTARSQVRYRLKTSQNGSMAQVRKVYVRQGVKPIVEGAEGIHLGMPRGGGVINGRKYSEHALERMTSHQMAQ